ncbi:chaplin [Streptomyces sp. NPDC005244]|uniref:chaplin n=1 Tax=Streptomyces sp. NPDC005244 TaxID=3364708 RepID=UPI0036B0ECF3
MRIRLMAAAGLASAALLATAGTAVADPGPDVVGVAANSPGVLSGNVVQIPVDLGLNVCGNSIDVVGLLNPAFGNHCENG